MLSSINEKQRAYFWDFAKDLSIQCIMDQVVWMNHKKIDGPQKLGNYLEIISIDNDGINLKVNNVTRRLQVGVHLKLS